jgi:NAD(P)-dependent dehydrogenase (short-subunit alcohol dehydrogenase family)
MIEMHVDAVLLRRRLQHAKAFRYDFLADAVTGDDRDAIFFSLAHREIPYICGSSALIQIIGLQWTKVNRGATLQCNVDLFEAESLTVATHPQRPREHPMDLHLRGKRVLITGASKGIGAAAAEAFAEEGCDLRLAARSGDQLKALADRLRSAHQIDASVHVTDLRKPGDIAKLVTDSSDIDILVNNAGDIPGGSIDKIDEATWRHAWELKVFGYINLTRAIYAQMKARGHGVIVNDIGAAGEKFDANYICGSAGNAALMAFTRALGGKSLADNIRVVGINPGPVGTDRHVTLLKTRAKNQFGDENRYKEFQKGLPLGRPAHAREIGDLMAYLASDRSGYTSGVIFTVDGGISAGWG